MTSISVTDANDQADYMTDDFWGFGSLAFDVGPGDTIYVDILDLTADGQALAKAALAIWSAYTGINFQYGNYTQTTYNADGSINTLGTENSIVFDDDQSGAFAGPDALYFGIPTTNGADNTVYSASVNVSVDWINYYGTSIDSYSFQTYLHEIGHALGLGHAGPYDGSATYGVDNQFDFDSWQMTIMSYFSQTENTDIVADFAYVVSPMMADIIAMQNLYGVAGNLRTDDTTYGIGGNGFDLFGSDVEDLVDSGTAGAPMSLTILDDGGEDTFDFSDDILDQEINLVAGGISSVYGITGNVIIFFSTTIENAYAGSGNDTMLGNSVANKLYGGAGVDTIDGDNGNDWLYGGSGEDIIDGGTGHDRIYGEADADVMYGDAGNDHMYGGAGNDQIYGGAGADTMRGGAGADAFYGGANDDTVSYDSSTSRVIVDLQNSGTTFGDAVGDTYDSIEYFVASNWADQLRGDSGSNNFNGGARSDRLYGRGGDDILDGDLGADAIYGNSGIDVMTGGDDTLRDRFIYFNLSESGTGLGNRDIITDFTSGEDRIEISRFDAQADVAGNNAFDFIGTSQFNGTSGQLRYQKYGAYTLVSADVDGDGVADWEVQLAGVMDLTEFDFLL
jgi:serralysin